MYYVSDSCPGCGIAAPVCLAFPAAGGRSRLKCCPRCDHRQRRVELPETEAPAPPTSTRVEVLDPADEDELVAAVLEVAAEDDAAGGRVEEYADRPGVAAYRALAKSRGAELEEVVRLAVRGRLADVVRRPVVTTPDPATARPDSTDEGDHDV
ncbi:MAG: hypothetical protein H0W95_03255 [Nocardioidaceae bacterium]|nr:hypothetical protein [Nocardioidaceae bacterium]